MKSIKNEVILELIILYRVAINVNVNVNVTRACKNDVALETSLSSTVVIEFQYEQSLVGDKL